MSNINGMIDLLCSLNMKPGLNHDENFKKELHR